jgi:LacI family transcriptional regulator
MKQVTLSDVATELGISKFSVSRALTGRPGVSEETRQRVFAAARALGYEHASLERPAVATGRRTVVLLIPHQDVEDAEFWLGLIGGASREADALGYTFVTRPLGSGGEHTPPPMDAVAGVIVAGSRARPAMGPYVRAGVPASLATYAEPLERFDTVHSADHEAGSFVTQHLLDLGHRRLAYVTEAPAKPSFAARARGFRAAAAAAPDVHAEEIHLDPDEPGLSFERVYRALAAEGSGPTAIVTSTDGIAFVVAWALGRLGLAVPGDVSLVGFNDAVASARFVPKLTTVRIATAELGAMAMRFLHERIEGSAVAARRLELAPTFVQRDSTSAPRAAAVALRLEEASR